MKKETERRVSTTQEAVTVLLPITALTAYGILLPIIGEMVQRHSELYNALFRTYGEAVANVVLGHLGNATAPIGYAGLMGMVAYFAVRESKKLDTKKICLNAVIYMSLISSITYMFAEIHSILANYPPSTNSWDFSGGELQDMFAYTVPFISFVLYVLLQIGRKFAVEPEPNEV